jgi:hypothetical protein
LGEQLARFGEVAATFANGKSFAAAKACVELSLMIAPILVGADPIGDHQGFGLMVWIVWLNPVTAEKSESLLTKAFFANRWALVQEDRGLKCGFELVGPRIGY